VEEHGLIRASRTHKSHSALAVVGRRDRIVDKRQGKIENANPVSLVSWGAYQERNERTIYSGTNVAVSRIVEEQAFMPAFRNSRTKGL
jgi:hypothetical protein